MTFLGFLLALLPLLASGQITNGLIFSVTFDGFLADSAGIRAVSYKAGNNPTPQFGSWGAPSIGSFLSLSTGDYVRVPSNPISGTDSPFTISISVQMAAWGQDLFWISSQTASDAQSAGLSILQKADGTIAATAGGNVAGGAQARTTGTYSEGTWVHVTAVFNPGGPRTLTLFVNGASAASASLAAGSYSLSNSMILAIGTSGDTLGSTSRVLSLDSVGIWSRALSAAEVAVQATSSLLGASVVRVPAVTAVSAVGSTGGSVVVSGYFGTYEGLVALGGSASSAPVTLAFTPTLSASGVTPLPVVLSGTVFTTTSSPSSLTTTVSAGAGANFIVRGCPSTVAGGFRCLGPLSRVGSWSLSSNLNEDDGINGPFTAVRVSSRTSTFQNGYLNINQAYVSLGSGNDIVMGGSVTYEIEILYGSRSDLIGDYIFGQGTSSGAVTWYLKVLTGTATPNAEVSFTTGNNVNTKATFKLNCDKNVASRLALVYDAAAGTLQVFNDNAWTTLASSTSTSVSAPGGVYGDRSHELTLGNIPGGSSSTSFSGFVRNFRVYSTALTLAQLSEPNADLREIGVAGVGYFSYLAPVITASNMLAPSGGTATLTGSNFGTSSAIAAIKATFTGSSVSASWVSSTQVLIQVPAGSGTSKMAYVFIGGQSNAAPGANLTYASFTFQDPYANLPSLLPIGSAVNAGAVITAAAVGVQASTGVVAVAGSSGGKVAVATVTYPAGTLSAPLVSTASGVGLFVLAPGDPGVATGLICSDTGKIMGWTSTGAVPTLLHDLATLVSGFSSLRACTYSKGLKRAFAVVAVTSPSAGSAVYNIDLSTATPPAPNQIAFFSATSLLSIVADDTYAFVGGASSKCVLVRLSDNVALPLSYGTGDINGVSSSPLGYTLYSSAGVALQLDALSLVTLPSVFFANENGVGLKAGAYDPGKSYQYIIGTSPSTRLWGVKTDDMSMVSRTSLSSTPLSAVVSPFDYTLVVLRTGGLVERFSVSQCSTGSASCTACRALGDSNCGWCLATASCVTPNLCPNSPALFLGQSVNGVGCPAVTQMSPKEGSTAGGTLVTVVGQTFSGLTLACAFGTAAPAAATVVTDSSLTCVSPAYPSAVPVPLAVVLPNEAGVPQVAAAQDSFAFYSCASLGANCADCNNLAKPDCGWCLQTLTCGGASSCISPNIFAQTAGCPVTRDLVNPATASGPLAGGTPITVIGSSFISTGGVTYRCAFGTMAPVAATRLTSTWVSCSSPATTVGGTVPVVVVYGPSNTQYSAGPATFTYQGPSLLGLAPGSRTRGSLAGGTVITVLGTDFPVATGYQCRFYVSPAPVLVTATRLSGTTVSCATAPTTVAGLVNVEIWRNSVAFTTNTASFTYYSCAVQPLCSNCYDLTDRVDCSWCASEQRCFSTGSPGTCSTIMTPAGACPALSAILPAQVAATFGGTPITIVGSPMSPGTGLSCIFDGGLATTNATYISASQVSCATPPHAIGGGTVTVGLKGIVYAPIGLSVTYLDCGLQFSCSACLSKGVCSWCTASSVCQGSTQGCPAGETASASCPRLLAISPASGSASGGTSVTLSTDLSIFPSKLQPQCSFDNALVNATVVAGGGSVSCVTPARAGAGPSNVRLVYGGVLFSSEAVPYTYYDCGTVTGCASCAQTRECGWCLETMTCTGAGACPAANVVSSSSSCPRLVDWSGVSAGSSGGGTSITLQGSRFLANSNYTCLFEGTGLETQGTLVGSNSSLLACKTAPGSPGVTQVRVRSQGRDYSSNGLPFSYYSCDGLFTCAACITAAGKPDCVWCRDKGACTASASCLASSGMLPVGPGGTTCPALSAVVPSGVPLAGAPVTVVGTSFSHAPEVQCDFEGVSSPATVLSDDKITCTAGAHEAGPINLRLTSKGSVFAPPTLPFLYYDCSTRTSCGTCISASQPLCRWCSSRATCVSDGDASATCPSSAPVAACPVAQGLAPDAPSSGSTSGGTIVTISGSNFVKPDPDLVLSCKFGSLLVNATYVSDTAVTCQAPALDAVVGFTPSSVVVPPSSVLSLATAAAEEAAARFAVNPRHRYTAADMGRRIFGAQQQQPAAAGNNATGNFAFISPLSLVLGSRSYVEFAAPLSFGYYSCSSALNERGADGLPDGSCGACLSPEAQALRPECVFCLEDLRCASALSCQASTKTPEAAASRCPLIRSVVPAIVSTHGSTLVTISGGAFVKPQQPPPQGSGFQCLFALDGASPAVPAEPAGTGSLTCRAPKRPGNAEGPVQIAVLRDGALYTANNYTVQYSSFDPAAQAKAAAETQRRTIIAASSASVIIGLVLILLACFALSLWKRQKAQAKIPTPPPLTPEMLTALIFSELKPLSKEQQREAQRVARHADAFLELLCSPDLAIVSAVSDTIDQAEMDTFCRSLVYVFESRGTAPHLMKTLLTRGVQVAESSATLFRTDVVVTKCFRTLFRLNGMPYLHRTLGRVLNAVLYEVKDVEVDTTKVKAGDDATLNAFNLLATCQRILREIINSVPDVPPLFKELFSHLSSETKARWPLILDTLPAVLHEKLGADLTAADRSLAESSQTMSQLIRTAQEVEGGGGGGGDAGGASRASSLIEVRPSAQSRAGRMSVLSTGSRPKEPLPAAFKDAVGDLSEHVSLLSNYLDSLTRVVEDMEASANPSSPAAVKLLERAESDRNSAAVGGFFFLRYVVPAITNPEAHGIVRAAPSTEQRRLLVLVAKVIQNLSNQQPFGKKEPYMVKMNGFIESNGEAVQNIFRQLCGANAKPAAGGLGRKSVAPGKKPPPRQLLEGSADLRVPIPPGHLADAIFLIHSHIAKRRAKILAALRDPEQGSARSDTRVCQISSQMALALEAVLDKIAKEVVDDDGEDHKFDSMGKHKSRNVDSIKPVASGGGAGSSSSISASAHKRSALPPPAPKDTSSLPAGNHTPYV